jgi:ribosome biogenesis GTPase
MKGIVTKAIGGFFFPADEKQNIFQTRIRGKIKEKVYPGDYVEFSDGIIENLYPRKSLLYRPMVANVDQVLIVLSIDNPAFDRKMLDRFLVVVEEADLKPLIVINKIDLVDDLESFKEELTDYQQAGYRLFFMSVKKSIGLADLTEALHGHINVMTGPSGVGKSSLINAIVKGAELKVGEISRKLKRGVHTTRHVELLPVNQGGWVADTPGFTSLELSHIFPEELTFFYPEFIKYLAQCKFTGCSHTHEPDCAVKKAVADGLISKKRYETYQIFYNELTEE